MLCRIALVSWFLSALIASTAYSGSLNAFLMSPEMELPIDSLTALAKSGLKWNMVVYGEQVEERMATSKVWTIYCTFLDVHITHHASFFAGSCNSPHLGRESRGRLRNISLQSGTERLTQEKKLSTCKVNSQNSFPAQAGVRGRLCHDRVAGPA